MLFPELCNLRGFSWVTGWGHFLPQTQGRFPKAPWQSGIHRMSLGCWSLPWKLLCFPGARPRMALSEASSTLEKLCHRSYPGEPS